MKHPYKNNLGQFMFCPVCKAPLMREDKVYEDADGDETEVTVTCVQCDYIHEFTDEGIYETNAFDDWWS